MKNFKGTLLFALLAAIVGGLAIYEYSKSEKDNEIKIKKNQIYGDLKNTDVKSFSVQVDKNKYSIERTTEGWQITAPLEDLGDQNAIESTLAAIFSLNVEEVDSQGKPIEWSQFGINTPVATFDFELTSGIKKSLILGNVRSYTQGFYIKRDGEDKLLVGDSGWESYINKPIADFRFKKLIIAEGELVNLKIQSKIKGRESDIAFINTDNVWYFNKDKKLKIQGSTVSDYFNELKHLSADQIVAEQQTAAEIKNNGLQLANFVISADLKTESGTLQNVLVKVYYPTDGAAKLMSTTNKPIYSLPKARIDDLIKSLDDFRDKQFLFSFNNRDVGILKLSKKIASDVLTIEKNDKNLWVHGANPHTALNQNEVDSFIFDMTQLKANKFLPQNKIVQDLENEIQLMTINGEPVFSLNYGLESKNSVSEEVYIAKTSRSDEVFEIGKAHIQKLLDKKMVVESNSKKNDDKEKSQ